MRNTLWMLISAVRVTNFRSIADSGDLALGPMTVLVGRNDSGKSALLRALFACQIGEFDPADSRLRGGDTMTVKLAFDGTEPLPQQFSGVVPVTADDVIFQLSMLIGGQPSRQLAWNGGQTDGFALTQTRPEHLMVPVFSRRKSQQYEEQVNARSAAQITASDWNLTSRVDALMSIDHAEGRQYRELSKRILGLIVGTYVSANGKQPGLPISSSEGIPLDRMGEGVSGVVTLISELARPGRQLFLVEEPENDLHPQALRALLDVMLESLPGYQFVVSTHSDLVLRHLGSISGSPVYRTELAMEKDVPTTSFAPVQDEFDRQDVLAELGYESGWPTAWIVFEESSAEQVVRDALIPMFAPHLSGVRTVSARGAGEVPALFADLHRTVLFVHLDDPSYRRAWVLVDGDDAGRAARDKLVGEYRSWPAERFIALGEPQFERYYPPRFNKRVTEIDGSKDWRARLALKGRLAHDVAAWAMSDTKVARGELEISAAPVIEILRKIEDALR